MKHPFQTRLVPAASVLIGVSVIATASVCGAEPKELTNSVGMKLVRIEPGSCLMGQDGPAADYHMTKHPAKFDDADWDEQPVHKVTISQPFHMAATEVTLRQYRAFDPDFRTDERDDEAALSGIRWTQAVAFCDWLSRQEGRTYRLPTEAEWEYACRAGTTTLFHTGDSLPAGFHKWFGEGGFRQRYFPDGKLPEEYRVEQGKPTLRVAQTPANAWGLFDMHGNVAEWCLDWYGPYEAADQTDPLGRSDGDFRVIRGGSHSVFTRLLRSANRSGWLPEASSGKIGFRVVLGELPRGRLLPPPPSPQVDQSLAKIQVPPADVPFVSGPKPFVKIPPNSAGPLFSWHNHSPAITECPNGDLLAVWYSCVDEGGSELNNLASRLRRGATEWDPATLFWDGPDVNDHAPKLWWDGEKTLYHFARGWNENIVRTSTDNGATWSKARVIQPCGEFGNQLIRTREGYLVISHDSRQVSLVISRDNGQTWTYNDVAHRTSDFRPGGQGVRYPGIHAPLVQLADGRLMTISRNDPPEDQARFGLKTPISYSSDWGQTWTYAASEFPAISSVQRQVLMRLREGPLLLCSFTDQRRDWKQRKGLTFKAADGSEFTGYGLFAALSFDEGQTWPVRRLITPGGPEREAPSIDRSEFTISDTLAESGGYLAACQTRDGRLQLITSKNHYVFNLAWLKTPPPRP
jgi:formylglycine-generating enzyme